MKIQQFVMAYEVEQDRLRAMLPDGFSSLRPVLRINAEIRTTQPAQPAREGKSEAESETGYVEFNTAVAKDGHKGWLNIASWQEVPFFREGKTTTFRTDFLEISFTEAGIVGSCPAEKDNDGCYFPQSTQSGHGWKLIEPEIITANKEFCDCSFAWSFGENDAGGVSTGKTLPAVLAAVRRVYPRCPLTAEQAAAIPCRQVLGTYTVTFGRPCRGREKSRCAFSFGTKPGQVSEKYLLYHDTRWCKPEHREQELFAMLVLEGMQAGVSWELILRKEENFRRAFDGFDPEIVAAYGEAKVEELMQDAGIIRNRSKLRAAITNAQAFLKVQQEFGSFDRYIWGFTGGQVIDHHLLDIKEMPARDELSERVSRDLKKRGFKFVGPTIVYSYLQGIGIINDHWEYCDYR